MFNFISDKFKEFGEALLFIDTKLGFEKFRRYVFLLLFVIFVFNFKLVTKEIVEFVIDIQEEIHDKKMLARDELLSQLHPLLVDFRANTKADRILFFEYHNSKENMLGIPFKYFSLQLQNSKYGHGEFSGDIINNSYSAGYITPLYNSLKAGKYVYFLGEDDEEFTRNYPGVFELTKDLDNSRTRIYINVPGINQPVGFIVLEWMEPHADINREEVEKSISHFVPRINALLISKSFKN